MIERRSKYQTNEAQYRQLIGDNNQEIDLVLPTRSLSSLGGRKKFNHVKTKKPINFQLQIAVDIGLVSPLICACFCPCLVVDFRCFIYIRISSLEIDIVPKASIGVIFSTKSDL